MCTQSPPEEGTEPVPKRRALFKLWLEKVQLPKFSTQPDRLLSKCSHLSWLVLRHVTDLRNSWHPSVTCVAGTSTLPATSIEQHPFERCCLMCSHSVDWLYSCHQLPCYLQNIITRSTALTLSLSNRTSLLTESRRMKTTEGHSMFLRQLSTAYCDKNHK